MASVRVNTAPSKSGNSVTDLPALASDVYLGNLARPCLSVRLSSTWPHCNQCVSADTCRDNGSGPCLYNTAGKDYENKNYKVRKYNGHRPWWDRWVYQLRERGVVFGHSSRSYKFVVPEGHVKRVFYIDIRCPEYNLFKFNLHSKLTRRSVISVINAIKLSWHINTDPIL